MVENNEFNNYVEAYKLLNLKDKKKALLKDIKELLAVLQGINTTSEKDTTILFNREMLDLEKEEVNEEDYIEGLYVYLTAIKELIANYILED